MAYHREQGLIYEKYSAPYEAASENQKSRLRGGRRPWEQRWLLSALLRWDLLLWWGYQPEFARHPRQRRLGEVLEHVWFQLLSQIRKWLIRVVRPDSIDKPREGFDPFVSQKYIVLPRIYRKHIFRRWKCERTCAGLGGFQSSRRGCALDTSRES